MMYKTVSLIQRFQAKSDKTPSLSDMVSQNDISARPALFIFIKQHKNTDDISEPEKIYNDFLMFLASFLIEKAHFFLFDLFKVNEENTWQHNKELKNAVMPAVKQCIENKVEFPFNGINEFKDLKALDENDFCLFLNDVNKSDDERPSKRQKTQVVDRFK